MLPHTVHTPRRFLVFSPAGDYLGFMLNTQMRSGGQFLCVIAMLMRLDSIEKAVRIFETDTLEGTAFDHRDLRYVTTFTGDMNAAADIDWAGRAEEQPGT